MSEGSHDMLDFNDAAAAPSITFPCKRYPVKVVGMTAPDFKDFVLKVVKRYDF